MNINLGTYNINLKIIYKNNRNIYFRFDENSFLVVTCPKKTQEEEIRDLVYKNQNALIKMYEKALLRQKFNEEFHLLGEKLNVVINESLDETYINGEYIYSPSKKNLDDFVLKKINEVFNEEIDICKNCFSYLPEFTLRVRKMKSRWGVCNTKDKTVTLNTELIKYRLEVIDYVIIHELAHFHEGNHSKKFWDIVSKACPNYKNLRKELKK